MGSSTYQLDAVLNGVLNSKFVDMNIACLAQTMDTIKSLFLLSPLKIQTAFT